MATTGTLQSTIDQILGTQTFGVAKNYLASSASTAYSSAASYTAGEPGSFVLSSLYYFLLYAFVLFLLLLLVHYTVRPVFSFVPGARGFFQVPTGTDDKVYINDKKQPLTGSRFPIDIATQGAVDDILVSYDWITNFTMSVDIYLRKPYETTDVNTRLILYKTYRSGEGTGPAGGEIANPLTAGPTTVLSTYLATKCSMAVYLDETNNLNVSFYTTGGAYSIAPIRNIPLYEPFRLTIVAEDRLFTVYLNGRQTFQKVVPAGIGLPTYSPSSNQPERFHPPPTWADNPKIAYVQNLHLWPRAISYAEVVSAQPALARAEDFDLPVEIDTGKCV